MYSSLQVMFLPFALVSPARHLATLGHGTGTRGSLQKHHLKSIRFTPVPREQARKMKEYKREEKECFAPAGATKGVPPWILPLAAWQKGQTMFAPSGLSVKCVQGAGCLMSSTG